MQLVCDPAEVDALSRWVPHFDLHTDTGHLPGGLYLYYRSGELALCQGDDEKGVLLRRTDIARRLSGDFALGKACGVSAGVRLKILDATAGLGIDAMALRARGNDLVLIERDATLWAMLDDALQRLGAADVTLTHADAVDVLQKVADEPGSEPVADVVYLDPMFTPRRKRALPGKRMQYVRQLLHEQQMDISQLLMLGRRVAGSRLVLKRRRRDPVVAQPDWQIEGTTVRYDVYLPCR